MADSSWYINNPVKHIANTSLWTIPYEFICYISLTPLIYIKNSQLRILFICLFTT